MDKQTIEERLQEIICWQQYFPQVESLEECKEEFPNLFKSRMASMSAVCRLGIAAIKTLFLESLPGFKHPMLNHETKAALEAHNACLSSIRKSWEPIKE